MNKIVNLYSLTLLTIWAIAMSTLSNYSFLVDQLYMTITMAIGSFIAGATSEGGGAIAFPVMTLVYGIKPHVSRDFSLMIQSCGMVAASFTILRNKIKIQKNIILMSSIGAAFGNFIGFKYVNHLFSATLIKVFFCSLWMSFALIFYKVHIKSLTSSPLKDSANSKLFVLGVLGGVITSIFGTGLDIIIFSFVTLYLGTSISIATPTSVIIMSINSLICLVIKTAFFTSIELEAFEYVMVCLPVVIFGAPLGAVFISARGKKTYVTLLFLSIISQYIFSLIILPLNLLEYLFSFSVIILGGLFWNGITQLARRKQVE